MRYGVAGTFIDEIGSNQSRYEGGEVKRIVRLLVLIGWDVKSWRHIVVEIRTFIGGNETTVTLEGTVGIVEVLVPAAFPLLSRRKFGVIPFEVPCLARHDASLERLVRSQMLAERRRRSRFGHEHQGDSALLPPLSPARPFQRRWSRRCVRGSAGARDEERSGRAYLRYPVRTGRRVSGSSSPERWGRTVNSAAVETPDASGLRRDRRNTNDRRRPFIAGRARRQQN